MPFNWWMVKKNVVYPYHGIYIYIHIHTYIYVYVYICIYISSVQFICSVMSNSLWPHELQHARPPCPSPIPGVYSNSCPLSWWCHPAISSSVIPFSSCPQSLPASGSFPVSQLFAWGGQSIIYIYSAIKRSQLLINEATWMSLQGIMLSE